MSAVEAHKRDTFHRRSIRLRGFDYSQAGAYFVTICTHKRECLLGAAVDGAVCLSEYGRLITECWEKLPGQLVALTLDAFVVMPNHFHGIVVITNTGDPARRGEALGGIGGDAPRERVLIEGPGFLPPNASPLPAHTWPRGTQPGSLGAIVQNFKSVSTRRINELRGTPGAPVWQRNYYEHVVRNDEDLNSLRSYIAENPLKWELDQLYPSNPDVG